MDDEEPEPSEKDLTQNQLCLPTNREVSNFLLSTLRHTNNFHYFAELLNIGNEDPEFPHDLIGPGNKYEWEVIKGLALIFRNPPVDFQTYIHPSRELHRKQYHHRKGNGDKPNPAASEEDMRVCVLDSICAILENRPYDVPVHDYDDVLQRFESFPKHKRRYGEVIIPQMRRLSQPRLELVTDLFDFPNIGIPEEIYETIGRRTEEVASMLKFRGYEFSRDFRYAEMSS